MFKEMKTGLMPLPRAKFGFTLVAVLVAAGGSVNAADPPSPVKPADVARHSIKARSAPEPEERPSPVKPADVARHSGSARLAPELFEMLWMIVTKGADMGPTDGWFHPSKSRYGWDWLKSRDKDGDGSISREELQGPAELFRRLDRDRDGTIKADDFDWTIRSTYLRQQAAVRKQFAMMDTNTNGKVSQAEWDTFFAKAVRERGALTVEDLGDAIYPQRVAPPEVKDDKAKPRTGGEPSRWTLLTGLFRGELGSRFEGPNVGDVAPDFTLKTHDAMEEITLSKLRGETPVVLIFGSFT